MLTTEKEAEIRVYLENQLKNAPAQLLPYTQTEAKFVYPNRYAFYRVKSYIDAFQRGNKNNRWLIIPGLRGVGKTTILAQTYFYLPKEIRDRVLFISVDSLATLGIALIDALKVFEKLLGAPFEEQNKPIFLLLDEIQRDKNWALILKTLYDRGRNVFVLSTGSSAVSLQTNPDIARRAVTEKLYPLSFGEYRMIKSNVFPMPQLKNEIFTAIYSASSAKEVYEKLKGIESKIKPYWEKVVEEDLRDFLERGTLPFAIRTLNKEQAFESISLMIERMITQDLVDLGKFDAKTISLVKRLLFIIAESTTLSLSKASSLVGLNHVTLTAVLEALEKAELLIRVPAFGSNLAAVRKPAKYLFMSPAIRMSLLSIAGQKDAFGRIKGNLLEDIMALHFYREFVAKRVGVISYDSAEKGADFILDIPLKRRIAVEIGAGIKDIAQVMETMKKVSSKYGVVICSSELQLYEEEHVVKIPLRFFFTM